MITRVCTFHTHICQHDISLVLQALHLASTGPRIIILIDVPLITYPDLPGKVSLLTQFTSLAIIITFIRAKFE